MLVQVSEYLVDHRRVVNAGNDAHITTAIAEITSLLEELLVLRIIRRLPSSKGLPLGPTSGAGVG